jgi:type I restriction enzyme, S subunit
MNTKWPRVRLSEIMTPVARAEVPVPGKNYRQIGVKLWGRGAYEREPIDGAETKYSHLFLTETNDIIVNKIWARNGSVGMVPNSLAGCYASGEFPMFTARSDTLNPNWMHWLTKTPYFWAQCDEKSQGTSGKNRIRTERFLEINIPLPPLEEQKRIVAKIEELASQIDEARTLRQQAIKETEALMSSTVSTHCFGKYPLHTFGEFLSEAKNCIYKPPIFWGRGLPCIRMYNIDGPRLNQARLQLLEVTKEEIEIYGCNPGDLVFNRVNSAELVGKTGLVTQDYPLSTFESKNMRLRVDRSRVLPEFAALVLNSVPVRTYYRQVLKQQCGMATLNQGHVHDIPFPSLDILEQSKIVKKVSTLQSEVDRAKQIQTETVVELDALLPSILDKAFKGEL